MSTAHEDRNENQDTPAFEDALAQLETIVETMETGAVPLAEMVAKFEQGNELLKICQQRLNEAELKIEQLKSDGTSLKFEPFPHNAQPG